VVVGAVVLLAGLALAGLALWKLRGAPPYAGVDELTTKIKYLELELVNLNAEIARLGNTIDVLTAKLAEDIVSRRRQNLENQTLKRRIAALTGLPFDDAPGNPATLANLRRLLVDRFTVEELRILAHDADANFPDVAGENKTSLAFRLVEHFSNRGQITQLITLLRQARTDVVWTG
jgi:hypothetical protein